MIICNIKLKNKQSGAVLFTSLMFLIVLTMLAITSMSTNTLEEKMASNSQEANYSFQAAESALPVAWEDFWDSAPAQYNNFTPVTLSDFDGNSTSVSYSATYIQDTDPTRCENRNTSLCNEQGLTAKKHYQIKSTSTTSTGLVTEVNAGGFRWGPATN